MSVNGEEQWTHVDDTENRERSEDTEISNTERSKDKSLKEDLLSKNTKSVVDNEIVGNQDITDSVIVNPVVNRKDYVYVIKENNNFICFTQDIDSARNFLNVFYNLKIKNYTNYTNFYSESSGHHSHTYIRKVYGHISNCIVMVDRLLFSISITRVYNSKTVLKNL